MARKHGFFRPHLGRGFPQVASTTLIEGASFPLDAPVLSWLTDQTDTTPAFNIDLDPDALSTDYVHIQVSSSSGFASIAQEETVEVSSIDSSLGLDALTDGTWYVRARMERPSGTAASAWSSSVSQTIDTTAPGFSSSTTANCAENAQLAFSIVNDEAVTLAITGGADQAKFELASGALATSHTLRWAGNVTKNYESPDDADTNNTYVVQVTATDAAGNTANQTITITVTDVAEGMDIALSDQKSQTTDESSTTWSVALGSYNADRVTILAIAHRPGSGAGVISAVTLDGVAATNVTGASVNGGSIDAELWYIDTGVGTAFEDLTTASLVVTWSTTQQRAAAFVLRAVTTTPAPSDTEEKSNTSAASLTHDNPLTIPSNGAAVALFAHRAPTVATDITWTNVTKAGTTYAQLESQSTFGVAISTTAGTPTIAAGISGAANSGVCLVAAAWGP